MEISGSTVVVRERNRDGRSESTVVVLGRRSGVLGVTVVSGTGRKRSTRTTSLQA